MEEDCNLYFAKDDLLKLCKFYLNDELTDVYINYIADCLTLSESVVFETHELMEFLEEMTDPEINGGITKSRVTSIITAIE